MMIKKRFFAEEIVQTASQLVISLSVQPINRSMDIYKQTTVPIRGVDGLIINHNAAILLLPYLCRVW